MIRKHHLKHTIHKAQQRNYHWESFELTFWHTSDRKLEKQISWETDWKISRIRYHVTVENFLISASWWQNKYISHHEFLNLLHMYRHALPSHLFQMFQILSHNVLSLALHHQTLFLQWIISIIIVATIVPILNYLSQLLPISVSLCSKIPWKDLSIFTILLYHCPFSSRTVPIRFLLVKFVNELYLGNANNTFLFNFSKNRLLQPFSS